MNQFVVLRVDLPCLNTDELILVLHFFHSQSPQLQIQTYTHPHACHKYRWVGECVHEWVTTEFHAGFLEQLCDSSYVVCIVLNTVYPDAGVHRKGESWQTKSYG